MFCNKISLAYIIIPWLTIPNWQPLDPKWEESILSNVFCQLVLLCHRNSKLACQIRKRNVLNNRLFWQSHPLGFGLYEHVILCQVCLNLALRHSILTQIVTHSDWLNNPCDWQYGFYGSPSIKAMYLQGHHVAIYGWGQVPLRSSLFFILAAWSWFFKVFEEYQDVLYIFVIGNVILYTNKCYVILCICKSGF